MGICSNRVFGSLGARALLVCLLLLSTLFPSASAGTLSPDLEEVLLEAAPDELLPVVVLMEEFPEQDGLLAEVRGLAREERRRHVVSTMKALAESSQRPVRALLAASSGEVQGVRVLWGINGVAFRATPSVIERLPGLPGVGRVIHDVSRGRPADGVPTTGPTGGDTSGPNPEATIVGEVTAMGAPRVWDELGYTGAGVIVAVIDTGVWRDHPDLADHIWTNVDEVPGNGLDDDGNGFVDDTWGWDLCNDDNEPTDGSHGTQVAGQVAGDGTNGTQTGMAPDAEIMAIGIQCSPPDSIGWAASQYAIENGAHIITESFIWPWEEDTPDFEGWRRQTDTQLAAGILHLNAAGNDGGGPPYVPYNVSTPANCPPPWLHEDQTTAGGLSSTVTVANVEWSTDVIAPSSSRGPSAWEDIVELTDPDYPWPLTPGYMDYPYENGAAMGLLKPDLAAYGNGTTTTCPGTGYCSFSGTSAATPHVAGVAALMLQANPDATPAELAEALMTTAEHRGDPGKNNVYGTGLVQAHEAVLAVESGVVYHSHVVDDSEHGNGDGALDPGEQVVVRITVESRRETPIAGLVGILSSPTPGVTVHTHHASFPSLPAGGTVTSQAPHFSLSVDPAACATVVVLDLELRYEGRVRHSSFSMRVGDETPWDWLDDDFETDTGWTSDPGTTTRGAFVREDPEGTIDDQSRLANPEDDSSPAGSACWVTGNGQLSGKAGVDNNDVDEGAAALISPAFGSPHMLSLELSYDRWYYDVDGGNSFRAEVSNDSGQSWILLEERLYGAGSGDGWTSVPFDLLSLIAPTDEMLLRFLVEDDGVDDPVEGAIDEVHVTGVRVVCQDHVPPAALPPNPVGDTLRVSKDPGGHALLSWQSSPVDGSHDAATLYRIERAASPDGPFAEAGSSTVTSWRDIDALAGAETFHYRVIAENSGGAE